MNLAAVLGLGFVLGMRHALDADHLAAVSAIIAREKSLRSAAGIGMLWGVGHTLTILAVGGAIVVSKLVVPPRLGLGMEFCVALMLVALGARTIYEAARGRTSEHVHDERVQRLPRYLRPLLIGLVHGMAGSAAVALLVLSVVPNATVGLLYLLAFGTGTIGGMVLFTLLLALPFALIVERFQRLHRVLAGATGMASVALGLLVAFEVGISDGLFSETPRWSLH